MVIDYRLKSPPTQVTAINGQPVEVVGSYKYLGSIIDDRLNFNLNTENICKKGQQRLSCLRKLAKFNVDKTIMRIFYKSYIESVLSFSMICWYGNLNVKDKASLAKVVKAGDKIIGAKQSSLADLYNRFVHKKAESILSANGHPEFQLLPSKSRFRFPAVKTNRYRL